MPRLAVAVVDEQHRFGVMQRSALRGKGARPHVLAMSATPIPRSLALTVYGDLDTSIIDELPPGRQPVRTVLVSPEQRPAAYEGVRREVAQGRQAFVVCPLVEESEVIQSRAAVEEYEPAVVERVPRPEAGTAARSNAPAGEGTGAGGVPARRVRRACDHSRGGGRHRRAERHRDVDRRRGQVRPGAASPVPRPGGPWGPPGPLSAAGRRAGRGRAGEAQADGAHTGRFRAGGGGT